MKWLIMILTTVSAIACSDGSREVIFMESPKATNDIQLDLMIDLGTYTSSGLKYCSGGFCHFVAPPTACAGIETFGDFTIYSDQSASFFNSIMEGIEIDHSEGTITLTTNSTARLGRQYSYEYNEQLDLWEIYYAPNCGRLYKKI